MRRFLHNPALLWSVALDFIELVIRAGVCQRMNDEFLEFRGPTSEPKCRKTKKGGCCESNLYIF